MSAVTLAEAKAYLNMAATPTTSDDELGVFIDRAEAAVVRKCGPLTATAVTERVRGGGPMLSVEQTPILSLTSVTPVGGSALTSSLVTAARAGVIEQETGGAFGSRWYDVTYTAGWAATAPDLPEDLRNGVLELLRHLWDTQRPGGARRPGSAPSDTTANTVPGAAYLWPHRATQLLAPYEKVAI